MNFQRVQVVTKCEVSCCDAWWISRQIRSHVMGFFLANVSWVVPCSTKNDGAFKHFLMNVETPPHSGPKKHQRLVLFGVAERISFKITLNELTNSKWLVGEKDFTAIHSHAFSVYPTCFGFIRKFYISRRCRCKINGYTTETGQHDAFFNNSRL